MQNFVMCFCLLLLGLASPMSQCLYPLSYFDLAYVFSVNIFFSSPQSHCLCWLYRTFWLAVKEVLWHLNG